MNLCETLHAGISRFLLKTCRKNSVTIFWKSLISYPLPQYFGGCNLIHWTSVIRFIDFLTTFIWTFNPQVAKFIYIVQLNLIMNEKMNEIDTWLLMKHVNFLRGAQKNSSRARKISFRARTHCAVRFCAARNKNFCARAVAPLQKFT